MRNLAQGALRSSFSFLRRRLYANKWLQSLLYDTVNVDAFKGLAFHEVMLADTRRVNAYFQAIRHAVRPGDVIIDLGTGTGILAMLAAQQKPRVVYAIDHADIIDIAKAVADHNKIERIQFLKINSRDFLPPEKADLIVHEQIGDCLFEENMLTNLLDLKRRALKTDGRILPARFQLFLEPVCLKPEYFIPNIWEQEIHGIRYDFLRDQDSYRRLKPRGLQKVESGSLDYFICSPSPILEVDLNAITSPREISLPKITTKTAVRGGRLHAVSVYFSAIFDDEISIDNSLASPHTSWSQFVFPIQSRFVHEGDTLSLTFDAAEISDIKTWKISV